MRMRLALGLTLILSAPALAQDAGTTTQLEITPDAYSGVWYEIARTPAPYEQGCEGGVTATYSIIDETTIEVENRCDGANGEVSRTVGTADVANGNLNTFSVELGESSGAPGINYIIAAVGEEEDGKYPWAAVHSPDGNVGWILSRETEISEADREAAEAALDEVGVELSQLSDTPQPPTTYDPMMH